MKGAPTVTSPIVGRFVAVVQHLLNFLKKVYVVHIHQAILVSPAGEYSSHGHGRASPSEKSARAMIASFMSTTTAYLEGLRRVTCKLKIRTTTSSPTFVLELTRPRLP